MSIHKSLKLKTLLSRARNVVRRGERLEAMIRRGSWSADQGQSVYGLPKLKLPKG